MRSNRALLWILVLLLALLLGLAALFFWLTGDTEDRRQEGGAPSGVVPVRSIYVANGENLRRPVGLAAADDGDFYVTLRDTQRIVEFDRGGDWVRTWGERGLEQGQMLVPIGVAVDRAADHVYVADRSRLRVLCFTTQGEFLWEIPVLNPLAPVVMPDGVAVLTFGPVVLLSDQGELQGEVGTRGLESGQFDYPRSAVPAQGGELIVADSNNNRVQRVALEGETTATVRWVDGKPGRFQDDPKVEYGLPTGVALDDRGRVFVLDGFKHAIRVLDADTGRLIHTFEELQGKSDGRFNLPTSIAYLGGETFAITDTYNDRVQIVRLLLPEEDNVLRRNPWLWWLVPLAMLAILPFVLGRKRWFATDEALKRAMDEGQLRLLAAVSRKLHVLPEVYERFADVTEEGVALAEYLAAVGEKGSEDPIGALSRAMRPQGLERVLLPRVVLVVADDDDAEAYREAPGKRVTLEQLQAEYRIAE